MCQPLLGTFVEVTVHANQKDEALQRVAAKAFGIMASVQKLIDRHGESSDVARLNRCAHISPLRVHPWTYQVLSTLLELSTQTDGIVQIPAADPVERRLPMPQIKSEDVRLCEDCRVSFTRPLGIDLSTVARGYAVDKAIEYLHTKGVSAAIVNAGAELRVLGSPMQLAGESDGGLAASAAAALPTVMPRVALASSAGYFANRPTHGQRLNPIVHPRTGKPLRSTRSLSIFAPNCVLARALAKAVLSTPQDVWTRLLAARDSIALFVSSRGDETHFPLLGMERA